ncbi:2,4-dihydroxyhept-2-ene-1,7-dioic acid aldolase [Kaistia algarum]|uniref:HpcH/HpaI aldolase family protein n=1 Tax=Kaistia algarum TaxID=2083279 RepID=UPI000CE8F150|nr:aldolase/citrate lyase family protein [Kaistia algarum]MCX5516076.1 aldolase/citrate lyase family protein [Kaistia algarum]PPE78001.1 2,4-dihydroxyhept-2-ene-1,7-dioic acid aldolase [Kaistia algarum]
MTAPTLAELLRAGTCQFSAWIGMPEPLVAEASARAGFDCVTLDMQHGLHDPASVMRAIGAVALAGKPSLVRIPVGDFAMASRALDMGARAVIAPMINSASDAKAFATAMKYPPIGERSWGAGRAMQIVGVDDPAAYLQTANHATLAFAMIETREAVAALGEILAVPGIDGIFVGPSDLSIALSNGASVDPLREDNARAIGEILTFVKAAGKLAATYAITGSQARGYRDLGFDLVAIGIDGGYLRLGASLLLAEANGQ